MDEKNGVLLCARLVLSDKLWRFLKHGPWVDVRSAAHPEQDCLDRDGRRNSELG